MLSALCEHVSSIIQNVNPVSVDTLGRGEFSVILKNGKTYRFTVEEI